MKVNTLSKPERLTLKNDIELLFKSGSVCKLRCIKFHYLIHEEGFNPPVKAFFSVPKRLHKRAVKRNLLKRRMKEAYRINKHQLYQISNKLQKSLFIGFVFSSTEVTDYSLIEKEIQKALDQISNKLIN